MGVPLRAALVAGLCAAVAALAACGLMDDDPSHRAQYGGHGGDPSVRTGSVGRLALDGRWRVALDPQDRGGRRKWHRGGFDGRAVRLPYVPNAMNITGEEGERSFQGSVAWYRTTVRVPRTGDYALRFESVNHRATVWIDGRRAGGHVGTYLPFEVRSRFEEGRKHTIVVRADWRSPDRMKATGWHRAWFNYGGINREVTIRPVRETEIQAPMITTRVRGTTAHVTVSARVGGEVKPVTGELRHRDRTVELDFDGKGHSVRAKTVIEQAALWSPGSPELWDLELEAGGKTAWRGRVGLREVSRRGSTLLLNGKRLVLRGVSLHEDVPGRGDGLRPGDEDRIVADLKRLGANATRAQHPLSPGLMERLDEAGIVVWQGIGPVDAPGAWTSRGPVLQRQALRRVQRSLEQLQTHPSVIVWNLANEVAGQGHPAGQARYVDAAARELHRRDPGRLVALDVWGSHPPREDGPMYERIDAIGWTNYLGWYEEPYASPERLRELIHAKLGALRAAFPDRVIAVTEFGAEGSRRNAPDVPGGLSFQANLLREHIRTYAAMDDLSGMLVWNLRDFGVAPSFGGGSIREVVDQIVLVPGLNEKGLMTYTGEPKPAAAVVREELARAARAPST